MSAAPDRPLYDDEYTGPRWRYALLHRPHWTIGAYPDGSLIWSERTHDDYPFGTVDFPRQLTPDEVRNYQLEPVEIEIQ